MIKYLLISILVITSHFSALAQYPSDLKIGLYNSLDDLLNNHPGLERKLNITHRSESEIVLWGGNNYNVDADTLNIKKSIIKKGFAVYDGNSLYINGKYVNGSYPFCRVENNGRYLIIKAGIPTLFKRNAVGYKSSMAKLNYNPVGGFAGGAITGAQLAKVQLNYIMDGSTGTVKILTKDYLLSLLSDYPDLETEFDSKDNNDSQLVLLEYVYRLNRKELHKQ